MNTLQHILLLINKSEKEKTNSLIEIKKYLEKEQLLTKYNSIIETIVGLKKFKKESDLYLKRLSIREFEVYGFIGIGLTTKEIADLLSITETTISTHRKNIIRKLQIKGSGQLQSHSSQYIYSQLHEYYTQ